MKYFLIAGERSGDVYGANLIVALLKKDPAAQIVCYGGDEMKAAGGELLSHYKESAFMGFYEVFTNLRVIKKKLNTCKKELLAFHPDAVIFIDYPGFNLRMAAFAKRQGLRTIYYISPKIWAWNKGRIKEIRSFVDKLLVIFPFEVPFYKSLNYPVEYVGNPLIEHIDSYELDTSFKRSENHRWNIAFLPGSRKQEVEHSIEMISKLAHQRKDLFLWIAGVDNLPIDLYDSIIGLSNVRLVVGKTYEILNLCDAAIVTSGTATLETALWNIPQVVCYKAHPISYLIAKYLVQIKFISLVNLIVDKEIVKELIQKDYTSENVLREVDLLLTDEKTRRKQLTDYQELNILLGQKNASEIVVEKVYNLVTKPL
ncbi:MAG: lipid-A-disaccharide synthase [Cyclobacteriaceae bacterium]|jgi:lipid-A-disaccharide synthase|tara:strand:+ start:54 stop:1163 length:1110 start_codon:yes stop_codon:yes gene_type:complete